MKGQMGDCLKMSSYRRNTENMGSLVSLPLFLCRENHRAVFEGLADGLQMFNNEPVVRGSIKILFKNSNL
jgi:hypothetical protein